MVFGPSGSGDEGPKGVNMGMLALIVVGLLILFLGVCVFVIIPQSLKP